MSITNLGQPRARGRADLVRGNRAGADGGGHRASGVLQDVRADGVRRRGRRAAGDAAAALARRARRSGRRIWRWSRASQSARYSSRPTARDSSGADATCATPISVDRRAAAVGHGRHRARSDLQPAPAPAHSGWSDGARRFLDHHRADARRSARPGRQASRLDRIRARGDAGVDAGASAAASSAASTPTRRICFSASPIACSIRIRRCGLRPTCCGAARAANRSCGPPAFPATCPSCWFASTRSRIWRSCAQLLRAHEYWRMKRLCVDLVILNERPPSYDQDLQGALEGTGADDQARSPDGQGACGNVFVLRADLVSAELRSVLQTAARAVLLSRRGTLVRASQTARGVRAGRGPAAAANSRRSQRAASATARRDLEFFNGLGGFAADGREYVTILGEGQWTPAPWINVICKSVVRLPGFGRRRRLHLGNQQPAESDHAVVERSGQRPPRRGDLRPRPATPASCGDRPRCRFARTSARLTSFATATATAVFEHTSHGISLELTQYVPLDDSIKISRLKISNLSRRVAASVGHRLCRVGARHFARRVRAVHRDRDRARTHAILARNSFSIEYGSRIAFADLARSANSRGRRTAPSFSAATARSTIPAALARAAARCQSAGPRSIPAPRCKPRSRSGPTRRPKSSSCSARRRTRPTRSPRSRNIAPPISIRSRRGHALLGRLAWHGSGEDARPLDGHHAQPMAAVSDARVPRVGALGILPGERRVRLSRSASGRDGADGRTAGDRRASNCSAPRRGSSSPATCSIGGCRPRAREFARASPTIASGCRTPSLIISRSTGDAGILDETLPFLDGADCTPVRLTRFFSPTSPIERGTALRTLRARARP